MDEPRRAPLRRYLKRLSRLLLRLFTRTTVHGLENLPNPLPGPLLILYNHPSMLDGPLVMSFFPQEIEAVGPGDFKLVWPLPWFMKAYGMTLIKRGRADRDSLKMIIAHLKAGHILAMAPEGGTWEKGLDEVKPGAAYVSQVTGAPILPVGISGSYGAETKLLHLKRPHLSLTFGTVMPAVPPSADRKRRDADLQVASQEIMERIYALVSAEDRARVDRWGRETYTLRIALARSDTMERAAWDGPDLPEFAALGELVAKPNLFRPMWQNAGLELAPFREARYFAAIEVKLAAGQLLDVLQEGDFAEYLPYRLGDEKAAAVLQDLRDLRTLADRAISAGWRMKLTAQAIDPGQ